MCDCMNVTMGGYENQVTLLVPEHLDIRYNAPEHDIKKTVDVDKCLKDEIISLWNMGVITTGCCCGHNLKDVKPYISVDPNHDYMMEALGYKKHPNKENAYYPKSVENEYDILKNPSTSSYTKLKMAIYVVIGHLDYQGFNSPIASFSNFADAQQLVDNLQDPEFRRKYPHYDEYTFNTLSIFKLYNDTLKAPRQPQGGL